MDDGAESSKSVAVPEWPKATRPERLTQFDSRPFRFFRHYREAFSAEHLGRKKR